MVGRYYVDVNKLLPTSKDVELEIYNQIKVVVVRVTNVHIYNKEKIR